MLEPAYLEISLHKFSFPLHLGDLERFARIREPSWEVSGIPQKSKGGQKLQSALAVKKILRTGWDIPQKS